MTIDQPADDTDTAPAAAPGVYVGPYLYAKSRGWLRRHVITHVINVTTSAPCPFAAEGIVYLRLAIEDSPDAPIAGHFAAALAFVRTARSAGGNTLIHCQMGKSRSVTVAAAILMQEDAGIGWREALQRVRSARPQAAPNLGFLRELRRLEEAMAAACEEDGAALHALDRLLASDLDLEEISAVAGPLQPELFSIDDAARGVASVAVGHLQHGIMLAGHRLAIDMAALPTLQREARAACWLILTLALTLVPQTLALTPTLVLTPTPTRRTPRGTATATPGQPRPPQPHARGLRPRRD